MNSIAYVVHALITANQEPALELNAVEQNAIDELRRLLQAAPQDFSDMAPRANGWTIGVVTDDDRPLA